MEIGEKTKPGAVGRNVSELETIEAALCHYALEIKARRRLPKGESLEDVLARLALIDSLILDCRSSMFLRPQNGDLADVSAVGAVMHRG